ncbi:MAG: sulfotransferase [Deltaproteobacteria bacterium]|nr:MAG: sulfotransferase [Desulfococcus sp. 4484_242]RLC31440.1 MAG: sulfotransferase [Deltaproteobacteria bacterium]
MRSLMNRLRRRISNRLGQHNDRVVDFVICGTQKGGTSALDSYLRDHPEICMANKKEVHFFDNESFFAHGKADYYRYHSSFSPKASHRVVGEATPIYMYWHDAPRRMWEYNPNMKLVVVLRNPIERAYSHWNMERSRNAESLPFWDAIRNEQKRCREALPYQHRVYSYVDRGHYLEQLRRLWRYFSKDNVLVLKNEYLKDQPNEALNKVCNFLEVDNFKDINARNVHSRPYSSKMSHKEREYLRVVFEHEIKGIERELGWDCSNWLDE